MATGIEQLGALAGPVNQGDVVMRQSEAPAGAAAILNKMARKNTPGVYKLPDTKPATPEFMQSAMANVQRDLTNMARNVESVGPEGHMLAYITPEEAGILKLLGGSGEINPATGIPEFRNAKYMTSTAGGTQGSSTYSGGGSTTQQSGGPAGMTFGEAASVKDEKGESAIMTQQEAQQAQTAMESQNAAQQAVQNFQQQQEIQEEADKLNIIDQLAKALTFGEPIKELPKEKLKQAKKLIDEYEPYKMQLGMPMSMVGQMFAPFGLDKDDPRRLEREDGKDTLEGLQKKLKKIDPNIMESLKKYNPNLYYKFNVPMTSGGIEDLSKAKTIDTSGMARNSKEYKDAMAYNNKVFAARETLQREKGDRQQQGAAPAPFVEPETPVEEGDPRAGAFAVGGTMPYTGERTGGVEMEVPLGRRFELGREGEMAKTGMDLQDAMKYATMGGYQQLEPFQEYIKRRRAYLGEEEPEYFDEEGNVIYSGVN